MAYEKYWPMRRGRKNGPTQEIYKCTGCGGVTVPANGHNGAPSVHNCAPG